MSVTAPTATDPTGYRRAESGLIVPEELSRERRVVPKDRAKLLGRCIQHVMGPEELRFGLECNRPGCSDPKIVRLMHEGHIVLRCGCRDRILETAF